MAEVGEARQDMEVVRLDEAEAQVVTEIDTKSHHEIRTGHAATVEADPRR